MRRGIIGCAAGMLLLLTLTARAQIVPPPPESVVLTIGGQPYVAGEFYLDSHADTAALKAAGCRNLQFQGRSVYTVRYSALMPLTADVETLPKGVTGVDYDTGAPKPWDFKEVSSGSAPPPRPAHHETALLEQLDLDRFTAKRAPAYKLGGLTLTRQEMDEYLAGVGRKRILTGVKDGNPATRRGTYPTSYYSVTPVETGRFHKPQNVGRRDPQQTGNFRLTPVQRSSTLDYRGIASAPAYSSRTGTFMSGTSPYSSRSSQGSWPVIPTPRQYNGSIQGPRRR